MKKILYWTRNYFGFSQREARGFIILTPIMLLTLFIPSFYELFVTQTSNYSTVNDQKKLDSLIALFDQSPTPTDKIKYRTLSFKASPFNPNNVSAEELQAMGVPQKFIGRIINFRKKGGKFIVKKDLLKIYDFPKSLYTKIENHILLPDTLNLNKKPIPKLVASILFDLNKADSVELKRLKGIGDKLSSRIVKYRNKLGGFITFNQLSEVYGLDSLVINEITSHSYIAKNFQPEKININKATKDELLIHPYFKKRAAILFNYKRQHGPYGSIEDLQKIIAIKPEELEKISPYVDF